MGSHTSPSNLLYSLAKKLKMLTKDMSGIAGSSAGHEGWKVSHKCITEVTLAPLWEWWWQQGSAWLQHSLLQLQGATIPQPLHTEGDLAVTEHWQMKVKWLAGMFNSFASKVLSAYFLNKSKTALMSCMTKQNAESFLVHHLFSCRGNLLSSPSQPIRAFTTFLQGWQWLEKIMRLVRDNSMLFVIRSVLSILLVSGCFTGNGTAEFCSTQTNFSLTASTKCSFADVNRKDGFPPKQQGCVWGVEQQLWALSPAPVEHSILETLCPSAEKDTAGSGKRTAGEWCWARTEMSFEHEMIDYCSCFQDWNGEMPFLERSPLLQNLDPYTESWNTF